MELEEKDNHHIYTTFKDHNHIVDGKLVNIGYEGLTIHAGATTDTVVIAFEPIVRGKSFGALDEVIWNLDIASSTWYLLLNFTNSMLFLKVSFDSSLSDLDISGMKLDMKILCEYPVKANSACWLPLPFRGLRIEFANESYFWCKNLPIHSYFNVKYVSTPVLATDGELQLAVVHRPINAGNYCVTLWPSNIVVAEFDDPGPPNICKFSLTSQLFAYIDERCSNLRISRFGDNVSALACKSLVVHDLVWIFNERLAVLWSEEASSRSTAANSSAQKEKNKLGNRCLILDYRASVVDSVPPFIITSCIYLSRIDGDNDRSKTIEAPVHMQEVIMRNISCILSSPLGTKICTISGEYICLWNLESKIRLVYAARIHNMYKVAKIEIKDKNDNLIIHYSDDIYSLNYEQLLFRPHHERWT